MWFLIYFRTTTSLFLLLILLFFAFANPLTVSSHFYFHVTYDPPSISSLSQMCEDAAPHSTASQLTAVLTLVQSHSIRPAPLIRRHRMQCLALEICVSQHVLYFADWEILIYSNTKRYNLKKKTRTDLQDSEIALFCTVLYNYFHISRFQSQHF